MAKKKQNSREMRVRGITEKLSEDFFNIAAHLGINRNQLLKTELRKVADSYPAHMRKPPPLEDNA